MKHNAIILAACAYWLNACGSHQETSGTSDARLRYSDASIGIVFLEDDMLHLKLCSFATVAKGRACESVVDTQFVPKQDYIRRVQLELGEELAPYAGPSARGRVEQDAAEFRARLNEVLSPDELAATQSGILGLERMLLKLDQADEVLEIVFSDKLEPLLEKSDERFYVVAKPFAKSTAWLSSDKLWWHDVNAEAINWYDAAELPRQAEYGKKPGEKEHLGCRQRLGDAWRLPTSAEARNAYNSGLRASPAARRLKQAAIWVSDLAPVKSSTVYAQVFDLATGQVVARPRWDHSQMFCVKASGK